MRGYLLPRVVKLHFWRKFYSCVCREEILFLLPKNPKTHTAMIDQKFHLTRYTRDEATGAYVQDGDSKSLEDDFGFCRYKSMTGMNSIGKQNGVYTESYAESGSLRVYVAPKPSQEAITSTLTVYSFGSDPGLPSQLSVPELAKAAEDGWHSLVEFLRGCLIVWQDDYRHRKALFLLQEEITPTTDNINGTPYLECQVTLQNVFGETFPEDDKTIEKWLKAGGKEAVDA